MLYQLQHYWWLVVTLLGAFLVFLMFVQGGQSLIFGIVKNDTEKSLVINALGHKWELTFTTLVTFGGAMFASFPLYYSTSFGGAYWLWMAILFLFVIQAVSFEYRKKAGNILGAKTYETFLFLNGSLGTILLGVAVGTFFSGGSFTMDKMSITSLESPVISQWTNGWHGLDAIVVPFNLLMGIVVYLAARTLGLLYVIKQIEMETLVQKAKTQIKVTGTAFVITFVALLIHLFTMTGYSVSPETGIINPVKYKYFFNMTELVWPSIMLICGVLLVLYGLSTTYFSKGKHSFFLTGGGVILAVWSILICAAFNNTAFFVSTINIQQSLTLYNSSSSEFTLKVMAYASLFIPFVLAYVAYVWKSLTKTKMSESELNQPDSHKY
ncbi:MAG: cytochrome d ubiquinol oxidase subunit II [Bacteroidales bacterium]|jgi:cytochrome d ubiquinol oxidase subunit II|nr:cytochrome d ubiquinol oxidase subunit II [Bacteroidales bacterium]MDD3300280.1 cytochrome d ubiquinol oxidase subunit II [Bacteroidales bacterium]MDD3844127.1 cytochrome d ubiquinol oxidase subunit II [Bacteroidales bacterium]MDD4618596.1 cytochrome d ubiquinol oxidase subunit II [Bacteroidales bacterium]